MGDLVNLRQVRKRKQRDEKAKQAEQSRSLHGRTRHERTLSAAERAQAEKTHDGHRRNAESAKADDLSTKDKAETPEEISSDDDLRETELGKKNGQKVDPDQNKVVSIFPSKAPSLD